MLMLSRCPHLTSSAASLSQRAMSRLWATSPIAPTAAAEVSPTLPLRLPSATSTSALQKSGKQPRTTTKPPQKHFLLSFGRQRQAAVTAGSRSSNSSRVNNGQTLLPKMRAHSPGELDNVGLKLTISAAAGMLVSFYLSSRGFTDDVHLRLRNRTLNI